MLPRTLHTRLNMLGIVAIILCTSLVLAANVALTDDYDVLDYVDPLIGTSNGGT